METQLAKGRLLLQQERWRDALEQFSAVLVVDSEEASAHCGAALAYLGLENFEQAERHGRSAVASDPHYAYAFYVLGQVLYQRRRFEEALSTLDAALELEPRHAPTHGLKAHILCDQVQWKAAQAAAELGLEQDPECSLCLSARSRALVGLGATDTAGDLLRASLEHNVQDPLLHASLGWVALEARERDKALLHFGEALRLDPELAWAREGMMQALRARYFVYRWILRYYLWISKLTPRARWAVILGAYFAFRLVRVASATHPTWEPYLQPLLGVYVAFVYLTWTGQSLGTLFLRLNKNGIRLLKADEIREANWVGGLWGTAALAFLAEPFSELGFWILGVVCLLQVIPVAATFACEKGSPRKWMTAICAALALCGPGGFMLALAGFAVGIKLLNLYILMFVIGLLAANLLISSRPHR